MIIEANSMLEEHLVRRSKTKDWRIFKSRQQKDIKRIIKKYPIDVVLMSLNDLRKEGMDLIKMIKKICSAIQIITINSGEQISLSIEGMKLGVFDDFLMPLDIDALISRINEAYKEKRESEAPRPSIFRRCQDLMVAASFAEAGETDMAKELLAKKHMPKKVNKKEKTSKKNERRQK